MNRKIAICGVHGVGKSKICKRIITSLEKLYDYNSREYNKNEYRFTKDQFNLDKQYKILDLSFIPEQFREVVKDIPNFRKQTEEITLATYAKQLYLENLYTAQGKNILCDRSVLDTFVYYDYFNKICNENACLHKELDVAFKRAQLNYNKIYLIEPSDREIENDGFRLTDKKQQLEIHQLFLEYFKDFDNVEIVDQEVANTDEFIDKVVSEFTC